MPLTTTTQISAPVDATFQRTVLEISKSNCPAYAGTTPAVIQSLSGNNFQARWRRYENFDASAVAATPLAELTGALAYPTRQPVQASITTLETTLQKYGMYITTTEDVDLQQFSQHNMGLAQSIGVCAGQTLNLLQLAEEEDNSTPIFASGAANEAAVASYVQSTDIESAINWLERNNAMKFHSVLSGDNDYATSPMNSTYMALAHPDVIADVRALPNWKSCEVYAGQTTLYPGEEGTTDRVRWVSTTDSSIAEDAGGSASTTGRDSRDLRFTTANTSCNVYNTVIYGMNAYGSVGLDTSHIQTVYNAGDNIPGVIMINIPRGHTQVDPFAELAMMGWKTWHAAKVLSQLDGGSNTKWCLNLRSGATALQ